jgi:imidazolonepropionase-like amidohydrolase
MLRRLSVALIGLFGLTVVPAPAPLTAQDARTTASSVVAIQNATILTVTRGTIARGTVLLSGGRIAAVGTNVAVPAGAEVYDGTGTFVTPGIIDAHSHVATDAVNEGATAVASMTSMFDVLDPEDINIYRALAGGTTTSNILHGSSDPIGGKTLVIKLRWGKPSRADLVFEGAMPGIKFALGENVKRPLAGVQGAVRRFPATRQGVEYVIRDAFTRAKAYRAAWQDYRARNAAGADVIAPRRDLQLEALVEVLEGTRLVHAHSYRADEILMLLRLAEETGFKIATLQHVLEGYKVAKEIAAHGAGASTFSDWWGYKIEAEDAIPHNAALMTRKGVLVSINSDDAEVGRRLNTEAAKAVRYGGLTDDEALATVTINPARQLRIDNRVGSIEVGKDADVVIWNRHPLSSAAIVERAYIDGVAYYDRLKDQARVAAVEREKAELKAREAKATSEAPAARAAEPSSPGAASSGAPALPSASAGDTPASPAPSPAPATLSAKPEPLRVTLNERGPVWALTNARIVTVSGPVIPRGTVVIRGNRIEAVGATVQVPGGARVVNVNGANVYPGMIDAGVDIGINEPGVRNYEDVDELLPFNQMLHTRVAYQSDSDAVLVTRAAGITTVAVRPGGASTIGGDVPVMNLDGWTWEENTLRRSAGLSVTFPIAPAPARGGGAGPAGEGGGAAGEAATAAAARRADLGALIEQARAYMHQGEDRRVNWNLEPFLPVLDGTQALIVTAMSEKAIRDAVAWAAKVGVRLVLQTGPDAQRVTELLKTHDVPVILSNVLALPPREDSFHAYTYQTPGVLAAAGIRFAFSSGTFQFSRNLPFQAGRAVGWGLDSDAAIRALTLDAARILGIDSEVGSIDKGKLANLIVVQGDVTEIRSEIRHVIVAGRDVPLTTKQTELYRRYAARP